jgi:hypothetical protein
VSLGFKPVDDPCDSFADECNVEVDEQTHGSLGLATGVSGTGSQVRNETLLRHIAGKGVPITSIRCARSAVGAVDPVSDHF